MVRGRVPHGAVLYARRKIGRIVARPGDPVLHARVKLTLRADRAVPRPAVVEVALDVNGRMVRAHRAAPEFREAIDLVEDRLADRLEHLAGRRRERTRRSARLAPGEWRHGGPMAERPARYPRPADERLIVERKAFSVQEATLEEAAFDLELLDHDFFLFREPGADGESLLVRHTDGRYGLVRSAPGAAAPPADFTAGAAPPVLDLDIDEAIERINETGEPYVFFRHRRTGHGTVLYWRYDGHYGLITPAG